MNRARIKSFSHGSAGFTLLEIMISISVAAIILTAAALCLNAAITSQRMIDPRVDMLQTARVAMALMSADLRAACPLDESYAFLGTHQMRGKVVADNIDFATHNYTPKHPREGDFCET
ncbi:MAG TPA: prepilin-type N-terminal cleavage/methylation domain-containing protein, partial [Verrucomicrobiae bacterium]|nr:prepilin-type N-terminal cleavage/methylation domain-containing protein [Verrucomicrobiae bacterium]